MLAKKAPQSVRDLGPSLNTEQLWFNQSSMAAPLPQYEKGVVPEARASASRSLKRSIAPTSARISYDGHATPLISFISSREQALAQHQAELSAGERHRLARQFFMRLDSIAMGNQLVDSALGIE